MFGTLSQDPNSTLGRGDTYKKTVHSFSSETSIQSTYELKSDLPPISEGAEVVETETKVDLSQTTKSATTGGALPSILCSVESKANERNSTVIDNTIVTTETPCEEKQVTQDIKDKEAALTSETNGSPPAVNKSPKVKKAAETTESEGTHSDAVVIVNITNGTDTI